MSSVSTESCPFSFTYSSLSLGLSLNNTDLLIVWITGYYYCNPTADLYGDYIETYTVSK